MTTKMSAVSGTMTKSVSEDKAVRDVEPRQVDQWLRSGEAVLIDVREPDENARERISGSHLVPLSGFDPHLAASHAKPGQRVVLHCRSGRRSADAARMLESLAGSGGSGGTGGTGGTGVSVVNMSGGIEAWKQANLPVEVNTRVTKISVMRQVQMVIGVGVLTGSALAWFVHPGFVAVAAFFGAGLTFAGLSGTCALASLIGMAPWNRVAARSMR